MVCRLYKQIILYEIPQSVNCNEMEQELNIEI